MCKIDNIELETNTVKHIIEKRFEHIKRKYGIRRVDIEVLLFLSEYKDSNTPTCIYKGLKLNRGHISQAIDYLLRCNYIEAYPDMTDRRSMHYKVSNNAKEVIAEIVKAKRTLESEIFAGISKEEIEIYQRITHKIIENVSNLE